MSKEKKSMSKKTKVVIGAVVLFILIGGGYLGSQILEGMSTSAPIKHSDKYTEYYKNKNEAATEAGW